MQRSRLAIPAVFFLVSGMLPVRQTLVTATANSSRYYGTIAVSGPFFFMTTPNLLSAFNSAASPWLWDTLLTFDEHNNFYPDLATVVPSTENGGIRIVHSNEVVTVHLKAHQKWSDGSPITGADYVAGMLLTTAPQVGGFCQGPLTAAVASTTTVTLTFAGVYAPALAVCLPIPFPIEYYQHKYGARLPANLLASFHPDSATALYASRSYQDSPLQRLVDQWVNDPYTSPQDIFSGPYRAIAWIPNQHGAMVPNPYYTALPPDLHHPRPAMILYDNSSTSYPHSDLATSLDPQVLPALRRTGNRVLVVNSPGFETIEFNLKNPALRDQRVRQALSYAIDRVALPRAVYPALTPADVRVLMETSLIPKTSPWSINQLLPANPYDLRRARALLAAAGYANTPGSSGRHLQFEFYSSGAAKRVRSAHFLQQSWAQLGISLKLHFIQGTGASGLFTSYANGGIAQRRLFDIVAVSWLESIDPGPVYIQFFDPSQIPDQLHPDGQNWGGVRDLKLFNLLQRAQRTVDDAQRHQLYNQFQRYMFDKAYWIPLYAFPYVLMVKRSVGNFKFSRYAGLAWNSFEWYRNDAR